MSSIDWLFSLLKKFLWFSFFIDKLYTSTSGIGHTSKYSVSKPKMATRPQTFEPWRRWALLILKRFEEGGGVKFDMKWIKFVGMWVIVKPSLVFNWVMFLGGFSVLLTVIQTVNLNNKSPSFLVWILVRKDNTDNKVFKRNFIQRNKKERDRKDKVLQIFVQFAENLS